MNRLCLSAGITLVESGSAGYLGQVTVIRKVFLHLKPTLTDAVMLRWVSRDRVSATSASLNQHPGPILAAPYATPPPNQSTALCGPSTCSGMEGWSNVGVCGHV